MRDWSIPAFGEGNVQENRENAAACVWSIPDGAARFGDYCALYLACGYAEREQYQCGAHAYAALQKGTDAVFLNAYGGTGELRIVEEAHCTYFGYTDRAGDACLAPQVTQVRMKDYGMSYVIRLSDGRFLLIDGGYLYDSDADALWETLQAQATGELPVIAAWILTHQHEDHFHCFLRFMEKYGDAVRVEKMLFNFPAYDDFTHYPELERDNARIPDSRACLRIPQMLDLIKRLGIPTFTPHTGQKYRIGDANVEFLACIDDSIHVTQNGNATSLVFRMELGGQVILWTADAGCSYVRLAERYGAYLKADILQVPHHGFQSGKPEAELRTYALADAPVCLLPSSGYCAYTFFCMFREGTRHLLCSERVKELIDGDEQRTLVLPYVAREGALEVRLQRVALGLENNGARAFVFSGLNTANTEDLCFTLLNMTVLPVKVRVELYFEDKKYVQRSLWTEIPGSSLRVCRLAGGEGSVLPPERSLPENALFAVRFLCDTPIVVSHQTHQAAYRSAHCF